MTSISTNFTKSLANMYVPFPNYVWEPIGARFIPDARNAIVANAIDSGFEYVMMTDADQWFAWDFFIELYGAIKEYGGDVIATGWAKCKTGMFNGKPSVFRIDEEGSGIYSIEETELQASPRYIEVDSFGTCGFLAPTEIFRRVRPPWFCDLNVVHSERRVDGLYAATQFAVGQDIFFANRFKSAGAKLICATKARMPHEVVTAI